MCLSPPFFLSFYLARPPTVGEGYIVNSELKVNECGH
jgi:hypothetical protein